MPLDDGCLLHAQQDASEHDQLKSEQLYVAPRLHLAVSFPTDQEAVTGYVIDLHNRDAYVDEAESQQVKGLLQWALNEASWDMLKQGVVDRREYCLGCLDKM